MKLIVHELATSLVQNLISPRNVFCVALRPHLVRYGNPTGTLKMQILDTSNNVLADSETLNISSIGSNTYWHGVIRFYIDYGLRKDTEYKFKLVAGGGYSFSESAYIGWCNDYDLSKYDTDYTPSSFIDRPLDLEIWERN